MTRPFDKHLDSDELDGLVSLHVASVSDSGRLSTQALGEVQRHVESCQDCGRKAQMHKSVQSEILRVGIPSSVPPGPDCVEETEWFNVAAGLLPQAKTRELMKHAAQCGHCGPLLKNAAENIADEATPSEEALLASLQSARPEWRKNMATTLRDSVRDPQLKSSWWRAVFAWPAPAYAFVGIAAVAVIAWIGVRAFHPPSAEQLLAQAYTERRTLEVRISGAKYAPMRVVRGAGGSNLDKPASLLKAEALISENLQKHPDDPAWLQAKARADLLDINYESAIKALQQALETEPDSPPLLTDLASAYFERAESADRAIDYGNAIEALGKVLVKSPDDPVALFNRALACERMFLYTQAVDDWQHYLRIDPSGEWAEEARKHLAALQDKLKKHAEQLAEPLLTPEEIANAGVNDASVHQKIDARIEDYLNLATTEWLPKAYTERKTGGVHFRPALQVLADIARDNHGDSWLENVLSSSSYPLGARLLGESAAANGRGEYGKAEKLALEAEGKFPTETNNPLLLRIRLEYLVAVNRRFEGTRCLEVARVLERDLIDRPFLSLRIQLLLEESSCLGAGGNERLRLKKALSALDLAKAHSYSYLRLRALGFAAEANDNPVDSYAINLQGLSLYWSETINSSRAYQFLAELASLAEDRNRWHLATVFNREAVVAIAAANRPATEAAARGWFGRAAYQAGYYDVATREWSLAKTLLKSLEPDKAVETSLAELGVNLAKVYLDNGRVDDASAELADASTRLPDPGLHHLSIDYFASLGRLRESQGYRREAESAFAQALEGVSQETLATPSALARFRITSTCSTCYRSLAQLLAEDGDPARALAVWEGRTGASLDPKFSDKLPTEVAVLTLLDSDDQVLAWVTTKKGSQFHEFQVPRQDLRRSIQRFALECADPASSLQSLRANGRELYTWLIAPVEEDLGSTSLLVVDVDAVFSAIPFEVLVDEQGRYLSESHAIAYAPGLPYMEAILADPVRLQSLKALIVSVPTPGKLGDQVAPLIEVSREEESVASHFPDHISLENTNATLANLRRILPNVSVFHFAGHASSAPGRTGLWLATSADKAGNEDSLLIPEHIPERILSKLTLVVLSACSTSRVPEEDSLDLAGLSQDFSLAGSKIVVGNKWEADSAAAEVFVASFYDGLYRGLSPVIATNRAQAEVRSHKAFTHPYFWSAPSIWL